MLRALDRAVRHSVPKPTALIVNFPSNPTAYLADLDFYREIVAFARRHEIWVMSRPRLCRDLFRRQAAALDPAGRPAPGTSRSSSPACRRPTPCPAGAWASPPATPRLIAALTRMKSYLDYGAFTPIQVAAAAALNGPQDCVAADARPVPRTPRRADPRPARGRLGRADAGRLDVRLGADPAALCPSGQRRVQQAAAGARQGRGRPRHRLRRARRRLCPHRAGREHPPAAPGRAQHPRLPAGRIDNVATRPSRRDWPGSGRA